MKKISEIDALKFIDEFFSKIDDQAMMKRILRWAIDKYAPDVLLSSVSEKIKPSSTKKKKNSIKKEKIKKKSKTLEQLSIVKDLNLKPQTKKSFVDFANEKKPSAIKEKMVLSTHYLKNKVSIKNINKNHIYTCFKVAGWRIPKNFTNMLHQAGSEGWLDTKNQNDLKITPMGDNLIDYDLPKNSKGGTK